MVCMCTRTVAERGKKQTWGIARRASRSGRSSQFRIRNSKFFIHTYPVRILGVDPGSITTGFGVVDYDRGKLALIEHGSIATARGADLADRLCGMHEGLL